jgi:phosphohistidine phosphatase SixA
MQHVIRWSVVVAALVIAQTGFAQTLSGSALVNALQHGGYVLVVRHASSPRQAPDKQSANADNVSLERELDEHGRETAVSMGKALRTLKIPIGEVLASPTYRAMETVRLAQFPNPRPQAELGDGGQSMRGVAAPQSTWLKEKVKQLPRATNTILVTHFPNMSSAFPESTSGLEDGETLVFGSDGRGGSAVVARIKIEEWPALGR